MKAHRLGFILLVACVIAIGCRSMRRGEPFTGPMQITDAHLANGQKVYMVHCQQCHPNGEGGLGPAINQNPAPGFIVKTQIRTGLGTMPSFGSDEISSKDLDDVVTYVLALRRQHTAQR